MTNPSVTDQVAEVREQLIKAAHEGYEPDPLLLQAARLIATLAAEVDGWRNAELDDCGAGAEANAGYCILAASQLAIDAQLHGKYTREEQQQFAQLIGYSKSGYSELRSYVTDKAWGRAQALPVPKKPRKKKGAPDGK